MYNTILVLRESYFLLRIYSECHRRKLYMITSYTILVVKYWIVFFKAFKRRGRFLSSWIFSLMFLLSMWCFLNWPFYHSYHTYSIAILPGGNVRNRDDVLFIILNLLYIVISHHNVWIIVCAVNWSVVSISLVVLIFSSGDSTRRLCDVSHRASGWTLFIIQCAVRGLR